MCYGAPMGKVIPFDDQGPLPSVSGGWVFPPDEHGNGLWAKREVEYVGSTEKRPPIVGKIERELLIDSSETPPDVIIFNGVEYRPAKG